MISVHRNSYPLLSRFLLLFALLYTVYAQNLYILYLEIK